LKKNPNFGFFFHFFENAPNSTARPIEAPY